DRVAGIRLESDQHALTPAEAPEHSGEPVAGAASSSAPLTSRWLVGSWAIVRRRLRGADHVAAAGGFQDLLCALDPLAVVAVDRDQVPALADASGVSLRLDLRDPRANQTADQA